MVAGDLQRGGGVGGLRVWSFVGEGNVQMR